MDTDLKVEKQHNLGSRQAKALVWLKDIIAEAQTFEIGSKGPIKYSSIDQTPYPPCEEPSAHLSCIAITNLKGDSHHLNSYIVLRCLTPPTRMAAIVAVMEDEFSNDIVLEMFHQDDGFSIKPTDVINIGAIILVKEPFCKITPWGQRIIRVDHITDVEFVLSDDPRVPPNWKECMVEEQEALSFYTNQGFEAFKKKEYWQAIKNFSEALLRAKKKVLRDELMHIRCIAYLHIGQYSRVLEETGFPFFHDNKKEMFNLLGVQALYQTSMKACGDALRGFDIKDPQTRVHFLSLYQQFRMRTWENTSGIYDFKAMQREVKEQIRIKRLRLDHDIYWKPVIIDESTHKSGSEYFFLYVEKSVRAGDLLLCEKAFGHESADPDPLHAKTSFESLCLRPELGRKDFMHEKAKLFDTLVRKVHFDPRPNLEFFFSQKLQSDYSVLFRHLYSWKVNTFEVKEFMSTKMFGCPASTLDTYTEMLSSKGLSMDASVETPFYGVWLLGSSINHSCYFNARRSFIGDMIIVRASRDLKRDTVVTVAYHHNDGINNEAFQRKLEPYGFTCECAICLDSITSDPDILRIRKVVFENLHKIFTKISSHPISQLGLIGKVVWLLNLLATGYTQPADKVPRILLAKGHYLLLRILISENMIIKSLERAKMLLVSLGFIISGADNSADDFKIIQWGIAVDYLVEVFISIRTAFGRLGFKTKFSQAHTYARTMFRIIVGEDDSFESVHGVKKG